MKLTIKPSEDRQGRTGRRLTGNDYRYILTNRKGEEADVTESLQSIKLSMGLREANTAVVSFLLDDIDVDAEFLAQLETHLEAKAEQERGEAHVGPLDEPGERGADQVASDEERRQQDGVRDQRSEGA